MRKAFLLIVLIGSSLFLSGCSLKKPPAALQIKTIPDANVLIDGKLLGKTPYQTSSLQGGELTIKLIPESDTQSLVSWEGKVKVGSGVLTLIEREFGSGEGDSSGQILTLEKTKSKDASLSVISDPDGTLVKLDGESKGFAPLVVDKISEGDHEIVVSKDGFVEKIVNAKAIAGYKLIVNVKLAQSGLANITPTPTLATTSATTTTTPTPKAKATPTGAKTSPTSGQPKPTGSQVTGESVVIKDTPTGWLRVRKEPSTTAVELAKVNPGEKYPLLEEKSGWYKIAYEEGKEGWISATYATKE